MNTEGTSSIRCSVTARGTLTDCSVGSESPAGFGFGAQSTSCLAHLFRVAPADQDGVPVSGGQIALTIHWQLPKD